MRFFGGFLAAIGLLSAALYFLDMNFIFLNWINKWGPGVAWSIRGGLIVVGLLLYVLGKPSDEE